MLKSEKPAEHAGGATSEEGSVATLPELRPVTFTRIEDWPGGFLIRSEVSESGHELLLIARQVCSLAAELLGGGWEVCDKSNMANYSFTVNRVIHDPAETKIISSKTASIPKFSVSQTRRGALVTGSIIVDGAVDKFDREVMGRVRSWLEGTAHTDAR